jgi:hypothetical protein
MTAFPFLTPSTYRTTSSATTAYNCIAWAAGDASKWWWPLSGVYYWPAGVPFEETIAAFTAAFATLGFQPCSSGNLEPGLEKVAIYATAAGTVTHMARQLPDGTWTSKLGRLEDIQHSTPHDVEGSQYGQAVKYLAKSGTN